MQTTSESDLLLALLGWPEIIGVLIVILVLVGVRRLPDLWKGIHSGLRDFDERPLRLEGALEGFMENPRRKR